jgi:hypothetical protein
MTVDAWLGVGAAAMATGAFAPLAMARGPRTSGEENASAEGFFSAGGEAPALVPEKHP